MDKKTSNKLNAAKGGRAYSKLTIEDKRYIKSSKMGVTELATKFNVSRSAIYNVKNQNV